MKRTLVSTDLGGGARDLLKLLHVWVKVELEDLAQRGACIRGQVEASNLRHFGPMAFTDTRVAHNGDDWYDFLHESNGSNDTVLCII